MWQAVERALGVVGGLIVLLVALLRVQGTSGVVLGVLALSGGVALVTWLVIRILRRRPTRDSTGVWMRARIDFGFGHPPDKR